MLFWLIKEAINPRESPTLPAENVLKVVGRAVTIEMLDRDVEGRNVPEEFSLEDQARLAAYGSTSPLAKPNFGCPEGSVEAADYNDACQRLAGAYLTYLSTPNMSRRQLKAAGDELFYADLDKNRANTRAFKSLVRKRRNSE